MFERNLEDLIRGLRANKKNESVFIGQVLSEIRDELKSNDFAKKSLAISKLTYLQMVGVDISWASFNVIEVMTQQKFTAKRIGYLAACQSFHEGTEVITLATNLIRKDMTSANVWESGLAINCLANICTPDLARDLAADIVTLLSSSRPYIRKKACLVLYKIFLKFPDALRPAFPRLKEKLEDPDQSVVDAAVNVICELARKNPKNYISLAPILFKIMTATDRPANNWVLIKIVKLFASLLPIEQRLAKKLVQPLTNLMNTTTAMSLQYECIQTCTVGLSDHLPTIKLCISKLRNFVEDPDQNLKYLGLLALNNIMKIHPKAVAEHRDLVLNCLEDQDTSIRLRALDLLEGMVGKRNIVDIVRKLLENIEKAESGQYKDALVEKIISICSKNSYQSVGDFEWYISVLMELAHTTGTAHGNLISAQFMDVIIRVNVVREFGVRNMLSLLRDSSLLSDNLKEGANCEVLYAAAWAVGEFSGSVEDKLGAVEALLQPRVVHLPSHIQSIYMQSALKLFGSAAAPATPKEIGSPRQAGPAASKAYPKLQDIVKIMQARLPLFTQSQYLEVQERACFDLEVLNLYNELQSAGTDVGADLVTLFDEPLNPVAPKAQRKVPVPEGLDLDQWINEQPEEYEHEEDTLNAFDYPGGAGNSKNDKYWSEFIETSEDDKGYSSRGSDTRGATTSRPRINSPFMLSGATEKKSNVYHDMDIPTSHISANELGLAEKSDVDYKRRLQSGARASKSSRSRQKVTPTEILKDEDLEGDEPEIRAKDEDTEEDALNKVDLRTPLGQDERLPQPSHRITKVPEKVKEEKKSRHRGRDESRRERHGSRRKHESSKDKTPKSAEFETIGSPPVSKAAYAAVSSPQVAQPEDKKERRSSRKESSEKDRDSRRRKDSKDDRKESSSKRSDRDRSSKGSKKDEAKETAPQRQPSKFKPLLSDENISVIYELKVSPSNGKKMLISFAFKNLSQSELSGIEFAIPAVQDLKVASEAATKSDAVMQVGQTATFNLICDVQSIAQPTKLPGTISYKVGENTGKKEFTILVPSTSFILPVKLEKEQFISMIRENPLQLSSVDVKCSDDEFQKFIVSLAVLLHVEIITDSPVSMYGKSVQNHHVAVLVKPKDKGVAGVQLKCTDDVLGKSLIAEVGNFFPKA
eukprot:TRINITY_DN1183_c0_g1_i5.p1 TRINITY_DN1183_c0_g1~~TRINITY_DN1183_c0_g1_i5.p1  ORF type:complete len:1154 (-),score=375.58 TRINITY_DN1183_c0_g1_i5:267-3728(-)